MTNEIKKISRDESRTLDALVSICDDAHYEARSEHLRSDHGGKAGDLTCPLYREWQAAATAYDYQMQDFEDWFSGR